MAERAVIARDDDLKGQVTMGLVLLESGMTITKADLQQQLITRIRAAIDDPGVIPEIIEVLRSKKLIKQIKGLAWG